MCSLASELWDQYGALAAHDVVSVCDVHQGCLAEQSRWPKKIQVVRTGPSFHLLPKSASSFPSCTNALIARSCPTDLT